MPNNLMRAIARAVEDIDDAEFERQERLSAKWQFCPRYIAVEGTGDRVFLDGCGRPICRHRNEGTIEILDPTANYRTTGELKDLYQDFGIMPESSKVRDYVRSLVERYGLQDELRKRWNRQENGDDLGGWGW